MHDQGKRVAVKKIIKYFLSPIITYRKKGGDNIYLTFDDGPDPTLTPVILKTLGDYNVKATFFLEGRKLERCPHIARQIIAAGHSLGSHTYAHKRVNTLSLEMLSRDIVSMQKLFVEHLGMIPHLFRPPYGVLTIKALLLLRWHGLRIIQWSLDSGDSHHLPPSQLLQNISPHQLRPGDILLFHDDSSITAQMLPTILECYHGINLRFDRL